MDSPSTAPDTVSDTTSHDRLTRRLRAMVGDAERLLKSAARSGTEPFDEARARLVHRLGRARAELDAFGDTAAYQARRAARRADRTVHAHPYATAGVAAGVGAAIGLLVGLLIARR